MFPGSEFVEGEFVVGDHVLDAGVLGFDAVIGDGHFDAEVDVEEAGEGHAGQGEGAQGLGDLGRIGGFNTGGVEFEHEVFEHGGLAEEVAHVGFVDGFGTFEAEIFGVPTMFHCVGVAGLGAGFAFGFEDGEV